MTAAAEEAAPTGTFELRHFECIMNTPALPLAVRCWHELLRDGLMDLGATAVQYDHKAIGVFEGSEILGVMTWVDQAWANQLSIALAYVIPNRRRQGVHSMMWRAVVEKARELKRPVISSGAAVANDPSRHMMQHQGRVETAVLTRFMVPPIEGST